jgi:nudix-type nucleoside diphosphatase (YffH/AdpP family)
MKPQINSMATIEIKNCEILSDAHYTLKRYTYEMKMSNGKTEELQREVYDHGNAATALLYNRELRTILLTRQFRLPSYLNGNKDGFLLETCAGLLEEGEDPATTMKREILEETGYAVDSVEKVFEAYTSAGTLTELVHFYIAAYHPSQKKEEGGGLEEEGEDIRVIEMPIEKALSLMENGEIRDIKAILLLQYALLKELL